MDEIDASGFSLDLNPSGKDKRYYQKVSPSLGLIVEAKKRGIPFVFGSDCHEAKTVGRYWEEVEQF